MCQPKLINHINFDQMDDAKRQDLQKVRKRLEERKSTLEKTITDIRLTLDNVTQGLEHLKKKLPDV